MTHPYTTSTQDSSAYKQLLSGRADDIAKILDHVALGHSIALFGERRIGKTSLLYLVRDIINGQFHQYAHQLVDLNLKNAFNVLQAKVPSSSTAIYISLQNVIPSAHAAFAKELYHAFCEEGLLRYPSILSNQDTPLTDEITIPAVFRILHATAGNRQYFLLFDEMEGLQDLEESKQIARNLRSIIQSYPRIRMILAGAEEWHDQIKDKTSPLAHNVHIFYLKAPSRLPVETYLIEEGIKDHLPPMYESSSMVRTIMQWSEGKAFYVQAICGAIVDTYSGSGQIPDDWEQVMKEHVFEQTRPILRDFYLGNNLDPLTKNILALLANKPGLTVKQIAAPLGYSGKVVGDKISDLVSLDKVNKEGSEYHVVGTLIEAWGRQNLDIPKEENRWLQRLKWIVTCMFILSVPFVYVYTHPEPQTFSFTVPNAIVSIQIPPSLEQGETGKALVSVQNTSIQSSTTINVFLSSPTMDYQLNGTNQLIFKDLEPGEKGYAEPTYTVIRAGNIMNTQILITQEKTTLLGRLAFSLRQRLFPLQKYGLLVSSFFAALGICMSAKNVFQEVFSFLKSKAYSI